MPPRRERDPEGRMPLREHLAELRSRIIRSALAIAVGAVVGWYLYEPLIVALKEPLEEVARERGSMAELNYSQVSSSFDLKLKLSVYLGIVVASPVWLYQLWAFVMPGLKRAEKRYALGFAAAAVPLFLTGCGLAWMVLPNAVRFLTEFTPAGAVNVIAAGDYLTFVTQLVLAFGIAFVMPLLLVALNMIGVLSAKALASAWRVAVFVCFLFSAFASPTPDAGSMLALAFPMVGLYLVAVGIAALNDRRRARRSEAAGFGGDDDAAAPVDAPVALEEIPLQDVDQDAT